MTTSHDPIAARDLMDRIYRGQRHIYDVTRKYYLLGRDDLIGDLDPEPGGTVMEIGCGTGRNLIAAADRYPSARLFGIDVSTLMLETARRNIEVAGYAERITLAEADATDFDAKKLFGEGAFDRVFLSYALSMIPPWEKAVSKAMAHVGQGGRLHIVDFGEQENLPLWFRKLLRAWLRNFHVSPREALPEVLRRLATIQSAEISLESRYRGYSVLGRIALS